MIKKTVLPRNSFQFDIHLPQEEIAKTAEVVFTELAQELEVKGFRKGKAPLEIARKEIKKEIIYEKTLQKLVSQLYDDLLKKESLRPITAPKIELLKAKENEDWEIRITVAEKPQIELKNYKDAVKKVIAENKKTNIWTPGQAPDPKAEEKNKEENKRKLLQTIFESLLKTVNVGLPDLLVEAELNKRLSQLVDDVRKIGLTIEAYLKSKNETLESLKRQFTKEIEEMYGLELILEEIAEKENIVVENKDLETLFTNIKEEKAREDARRNAYFYATLLRRQKTLDYLMGL